MTTRLDLVIGREQSDNHVLGNQIKARRKALHLNVSDVASPINVSDAYIRMIEAGIRAPAFNTAKSLFEALKWSFSSDDAHAVITINPVDEDGVEMVLYFTSLRSIHKQQREDHLRELLLEKTSRVVQILHWD